MKRLLILSIILVLGWSFRLSGVINSLSEVLHPYFDLEKKQELHVIPLQAHRIPHNEIMEEDGESESLKLKAEGPVTKILTNVDLLLYTTLLYFGTPNPQKLNLWVYLDSPWIWVTKKDCIDCTKGTGFFDSASSVSFNDLKKTDTITLATSQVDGEVVQDSVFLDQTQNQGV
jgi:hypothetical protein